MATAGISYSAILLDLLKFTVIFVLQTLPGAVIRRLGRFKGNSAIALPSANVTDDSVISIIIPTYNEEASIVAVLDSVLREKDSRNIEVVLADGGSTDETVNIVKKRGCRVVVAPNGRAKCLNAAAQASKGDILLFLHADTLLPAGYAADVRQAMKDPKVSCGAFSFRLEPRLPFISFVEWGTNLRSRYLQKPYGDQALFWRRNAFMALGMFPDQLFMEDYDLVLMSRDIGPVVTLPSQVITSSRRWQINGVLGNTFTNQLIIYGRAIGVPLPRLAQWYYGLTRKKQY